MTGRTFYARAISKNVIFFSAKNVHVLFSKIIRIFFIHFFLSSLNIDSQFHSNNIYLSRHFNFAYGFQFRVTGCQCIDTRDRRFLETRREWEPIPCSALPNIPIVSLLKVQRKAGTGTYFRRFFFFFSWNSIRKSDNRIGTKQQFVGSLEKKVKDNSDRYSRSRITRSFYDSVYEGFSLKGYKVSRRYPKRKNGNELSAEHDLRPIVFPAIRFSL